jgi:hypothetical protein
MGEQERHNGFHFLSHSEFEALSAKDRAYYLVRAQQELDEKKRILRQQLELASKPVAVRR